MRVVVGQVAVVLLVTTTGLLLLPTETLSASTWRAMAMSSISLYVAYVYGEVLQKKIKREQGVPETPETGKHD